MTTLPGGILFLGLLLVLVDLSDICERIIRIYRCLLLFSSLEFVDGSRLVVQYAMCYPPTEQSRLEIQVIF